MVPGKAGQVPNALAFSLMLPLANASTYRISIGRNSLRAGTLLSAIGTALVRAARAFAVPACAQAAALGGDSRRDGRGDPCVVAAHSSHPRPGCPRRIQLFTCR